MARAHDLLDPSAARPNPGPPRRDAREPGSRSAHVATPASMLQMQRLAGNAAVASLQREINIDEMTTSVERGAPGTTPGGSGAAAPTAATLGDGTGPASINGTTVDVSGGMVNLHAPMVAADGVLRAQTIMADTVIASSYTPGAGNIW